LHDDCRMSSNCATDKLVFCSYILKTMAIKLHNGFFISTVILIVLLCIAFTIAKPTGITYRKRADKEKVFSQMTSRGPAGAVHIEEAEKSDAVSRIADYIRDENVELQEEEVISISDAVYSESMRCNVDYRLILALIKTESNFKQDAISNRGARGLLQVKPSFAKNIAEKAGIGWRGKETLDQPEENIKIGVQILSQLIEDFQSIDMALHAYHVGPTKLREIHAEKKKPRKHYLNLVLDEYNRNISLLPAP
jgi:soluble lytic murein transglycosylase